MILKSMKPQIPISFFYGDEDWMEPYGAFRLRKVFQNMSVHFIKKAGHQLIFENPKDIVQIMTEKVNIQKYNCSSE